ncbi:uncharacterized protein LOC143883052 [Tasmannia lanceolata]|uniref:uncharacterized protein LOC143883052 n=1 Tax=Tasmannia lanceolata TaxID=3420 RepID=UPI004063D812
MIIRAAALVMAVVATATARVRHYIEENMTRGPYESGYETRRTFVTRIMNAENHCIALLRMDVWCFRSVVPIFRNTALHEDTIHCCVEEQVTIFLQVIPHSQRNRTIRASIRRSEVTLSKYFNKVLCVVLKLQELFILPPSRDTRHIADNPNFMLYFKDCIGAIEGTHIQATVAEDLKPRFICCKGWPSQNELAICDFDLKFTYMLAGWEGSASDSRVLASALSKPNGSPYLPGKFYLADGGYQFLRNYLTPIRGIGYYLNDIRGRRPRTTEELYNQRHSSARNVDIVLACYCVQNLIRREMPNDANIPIVDNELGLTVAEEEEEDEEEEDRFITRAEDLCFIICCLIVLGFGIILGCNNIMQSTSVEKRKGNPSWGEDMDRPLIVAIQHQIAKGQKAPNGLKEAAYSGTAVELTTILKKEITREHIKTRMKMMKTNFRILNTIVNLSGFGWDPQLKKISVEDQVKNDYLARNPEHLHFFNDRWELYEEMKEVFGEDYATEDFARDRRAPSQDTQDAEGLFSSSQAVGLDDMFDGSTPSFTPPQLLVLPDHVTHPQSKNRHGL